MYIFIFVKIVLYIIYMYHLFVKFGIYTVCYVAQTKHQV